MASKLLYESNICDKEVTEHDTVALHLGGRNIVVGTVSHFYAGDHATAPEFVAYSVIFKGSGMVSLGSVEDVIVNPNLPFQRDCLLDGGPNRWKRLKEYQEVDDDV